jgi:hypothetical protein
MDVSRNDMLSELANDAALERGDFVVQATEQLRKFLDRNRDRISQLGGLTLIDDDPDYLSVAPDLTFRVRSRFEDPDTGEWVSETEIVETSSELIELYNPAEIYQAFAEAAREAAGFDGEPTATDELLGIAGIAPDETFSIGDEAAYAGAADEWAATQPPVLEADDEESAARALYDLALDFQERSQQSEARLIEQFEEAAARLMGQLGDFIIVDDDDERLVLGSAGRFRAEVLPEDGNGEWRELHAPDDIVAYYDPTDIFGDLADAIAEAFPAVAPETETEDEGEDETADEAAEGDAAAEAEVAVDEPENERKP